MITIIRCLVLGSLFVFSGAYKEISRFCLKGEAVPGGIADEEEEKLLDEINAWVIERGLPEGEEGVRAA